MAEYIEREAVLKLREEFWKDRCDYMAVRVTNIMNIPAADVVEVRHGVWVPTYHTYYNRDGAHQIADEWHCSECKTHSRDERNYCPDCGAKMDGKGDAQ